MPTKLTLTIDGHIIKKAKAYAKSQGRSLSNLIEDYLKLVIEDRSEGRRKLTPSPIVKQLRGVIKIKEMEDFDEKKILEEELMKQYRLK